MFPPNFLQNRLSAHYIEINHIFAIEMMKRYQVARREILAEREKQSDQVKRTKYITNSNYVFESLGKDDDKLGRLKSDHLFWSTMITYPLQALSATMAYLNNHLFL